MDIQTVKQRMGIIGGSVAFDRAIEVAVRVATTDLSVLITGQSGVGKEFFPQIIHNYSSRKHNNYIAVNCGAIPEGTIDSELFGHEKGSFTGATSERKGYFEQANGGTIFLDEVAELPLTTQVRLLRVLQTGEFMRVGSSKVQKTDVRVVAATNINLPEAIEMGKFREDLFYRLNTVPIHVPPLSERRSDIPLLFRRFASDIAAQYRMPVITLLPEAKQLLESYDWPGNVRQLKNVAEQISAVETKREIDIETLGRYLPHHSESRLPVLVRGAQDSGMQNTTERDILYKLLFDLRDEVTQLRAMVSEIRGGAVTTVGKIAQGSSNGSGYEISQSSTVQSSSSGGLHKAILGEATNGKYDVMKPDFSADDFTPVEVVVDNSDQQSRPKSKNEMLRANIIAALAKHRGRRKEAAAELFMSERTLYRKIKELDIE